MYEDLCGQINREKFLKPVWSRKLKTSKICAVKVVVFKALRFCCVLRVLMVFMCGNCIVKQVDIDSGDQVRVCRQTYTFVHVVACDVC